MNIPLMYVHERNVPLDDDNECMHGEDPKYPCNIVTAIQHIPLSPRSFDAHMPLGARTRGLYSSMYVHCGAQARTSTVELARDARNHSIYVHSLMYVDGHAGQWRSGHGDQSEIKPRAYLQIVGNFESVCHVLAIVRSSSEERRSLITW